MTDTPDPRSIDELFEHAQQQSRGNRNDDRVTDAYWESVHALHGHEDKDAVCARAIELSSSKKVRDRELGVDVLAQVTATGSGASFVPRVREALCARLRDKNKDVLASTIHAFGHLGPGDAIEAIAAFAKSADPEIRFAVAGCLGGCSDDVSIGTLIELTRDEEDDVRDWACFGLGTQSESVDTDAVREALFARIDDPHPDTRAEAQLGLARRGDRRVVGAVLSELEQEDVADLSISAAAELGDAKFVPALERLSAWWPEPEVVERALERCRRG